MKPSVIWAACSSTISVGISASMLSATLAISTSSKVRWAASVRSVVSFFLISAFRSFSVSNSDTSLANSSSMVGTSFTLTSLTFTWNTTGLPASSGV